MSSSVGESSHRGGSWPWRSSRLGDSEHSSAGAGFRASWSPSPNARWTRTRESLPRLPTLTSTLTNDVGIAEAIQLSTLTLAFEDPALEADYRSFHMYVHYTPSHTC
jgi:hypothetical protein